MVVELKKTVEISLFLFGKPEREFEDKVNSEVIKAKGDELRKRLHEIAINFEKLSKNGWEPNMNLYDISFFKEISEKTAEKELKKLGIDAEVHECDDE